MITGVVLARNEEANIVECLGAFRPLVDELILIDMESSDATVDLARALVDRILTHHLIANFDAARNIAIDIAKSDWLWFCDADERPTELIGKTVRDLLISRGHEFEALSIPFKSYFAGKWIEHCGWWPGYTMPRVLKRGHFRFREQLHGGVQVDGREVRLSPDPRLGIDHYSYRSISHYYEKFNRYTSTEAEQLRRVGRKWDWRQATQEMVRDLWLYYERNNGKADGAHGWILSWLAGQYRWASNAKLLDVDPGEFARGGVPDNLDEFFSEMQDELGRLRSGRPSPPFGIVWRTPIDDSSGYAEEGRCFTKALSLSERSLSLEPIIWSDQRTELVPSDRALFKALAASSRRSHFIAITNCIPTLAVPAAGALFNVLRTTFETDRLPDGWLTRLDAFDEVWVISKYNYDTFVRSGFAPEKLRIVPSCVDVDMFTPSGPQISLPAPCHNRFVFLSVFDWQLRKGWDVLLRAYVREFSLGDNTSLLLKISRLHGCSRDVIDRQVECVLNEAQTTLRHRPDIVIWDEQLAANTMPSLYRSANAFVLATRGEGWGRPYMEAMACGIPVIGIGASGNADFMTDDNSYRVSAKLEPVSNVASAEIPIYRGHQWYEPDEFSLRSRMRECLSQPDRRNSISSKARKEVNDKYGIGQARATLEEAIGHVEKRFHLPMEVEDDAKNKIRVELQGEFLAGHSFSNVNERLAERLGCDDDISLSIVPRFDLPDISVKTSKRACYLQPLLDRQFQDGPQVVIRHAYPPDWTAVKQAKWVHIQPWEFGFLPKNWIEPLKKVDEIWVPSHYVRRVYERSGVSAEKIQVIPWGVDPAIFNVKAVPRLLDNCKSFRFVFVGGTIARKGFDIALQAYLEEFSEHEDVSFVIKDIGVSTVYRYANSRDRILSEIRPGNPHIAYFESEMSPGQLASFYSACHCLVAPYRGEGFGLPIIEAMACGVAPIVPRGGPSDDFVDDQTGFLLNAEEVGCSHPEIMCEPPTEFVVSIPELRIVMRKAFQDRTLTAKLGQQAAQKIKSSYSWQRTSELMKARLQRLLAPSVESSPGISHTSRGTSRLDTVAIIRGTNDGAALSECLARVAPFVSHLHVVFEDASEGAVTIAREYGAECHHREWTDAEAGFDFLRENACCFKLESTVLLTECDWDRAFAAAQCAKADPIVVALADGQSLWIHTNRAGRLQQDVRKSSFFEKSFKPFLGKRAETFSRIIGYLDRLATPDVSIVETGCLRMANDWGAGQSTLIFDRYVNEHHGSFISIDISEANCNFARRSCVSPNTNVVRSNSVEYLHKLAVELPASIDLLYLDSLDVDWSNPHPSALYHLQELCAAMPALKAGAMIVVDDHRNEIGQQGKSLYIAEFMKSLKTSRCDFEEYQIGWVL